MEKLVYEDNFRKQSLVSTGRFYSLGSCTLHCFTKWRAFAMRVDVSEFPFCDVRFVKMRIFQKKTTRVSGWWWCWYWCWCWRSRMGGEGRGEEGKEGHGEEGEEDGEEAGSPGSVPTSHSEELILALPAGPFLEKWKHDVLVAKLPSDGTIQSSRQAQLKKHKIFKKEKKRRSWLSGALKPHCWLPGFFVPKIRKVNTDTWLLSNPQPIIKFC